MATFFDQLTVTANNTGSFRAWVSASEAAFARLGWVNDNASGTINWQTVNPPTATSQICGYSVWRFNDALQSTDPVFIRIDYGSGAASATRIQYGISIGKQHNGSGSLIVSSTRMTAELPFNDLLTWSFAYSGDTGRATVVAGYRSTSPLLWGVERGRDLQGNVIADSIFLYSFTNSSFDARFRGIYGYATGTLAPMELKSLSDNGWIPILFIDDTSVIGSDAQTVSLDSAPAALLNCNVVGYGLPIGLMALKRNCADAFADLFTAFPYGIETVYHNTGHFYSSQQLGSNEFSLAIQWE